MTVFFCAWVYFHRAIYADVEVYLLDEILSAVDVTVGKHLVENAIFGLLRSKCVIIAVNEMSPFGDQEILYMENGQISKRDWSSDALPGKKFQLSGADAMDKQDINGDKNETGPFLLINSQSKSVTALLYGGSILPLTMLINNKEKSIIIWKVDPNPETDRQQMVMWGSEEEDE